MSWSAKDGPALRSGRPSQRCAPGHPTNLDGRQGADHLAGRESDNPVRPENTDETRQALVRPQVAADIVTRHSRCADSRARRDAGRSPADGAVRKADDDVYPLRHPGSVRLGTRTPQPFNRVLAPAVCSRPPPRCRPRRQASRKRGRRPSSRPRSYFADSHHRLKAGRLESVIGAGQDFRKHIVGERGNDNGDHIIPQRQAIPDPDRDIAQSGPLPPLPFGGLPQKPSPFCAGPGTRCFHRPGLAGPRPSR